jgi:hypothetical protein
MPNEPIFGDTAGQTQVLRRTLDQAIRTLYSDDHYVGEQEHIGVLVAATVNVLEAPAAKVHGYKRTSLQNGCSVLRALLLRISGRSIEELLGCKDAEWSSQDGYRIGHRT